MDLLWPQPPLTCSLYQDSTPGPLIPVVAACVKDARPSRWLAPLKRPRWPQHRPRVAPPSKPSRLAVESVELVGPAKSFGSGTTHLADAGRPKSKTRTANELQGGFAWGSHSLL